MPSVGVFCGCRAGAHAEYTTAEETLNAAGQQELRSRVRWRHCRFDGLSNHHPNPFAAAALDTTAIAVYLRKGGSVKGWIPKFLMPAELSGEMVGETEVTDTMAERKAKIFEASDA